MAAESREAHLRRVAAALAARDGQNPSDVHPLEAPPSVGEILPEAPPETDQILPQPPGTVPGTVSPATSTLLAAESLPETARSQIAFFRRLSQDGGRRTERDGESAGDEVAAEEVAAEEVAAEEVAAEEVAAEEVDEYPGRSRRPGAEDVQVLPRGRGGGRDGRRRAHRAVSMRRDPTVGPRRVPPRVAAGQREQHGSRRAQVPGVPPRVPHAQAAHQGRADAVVQPHGDGPTPVLPPRVVADAEQLHHGAGRGGAHRHRESAREALPRHRAESVGREGSARGERSASRVGQSREAVHQRAQRRPARVAGFRRRGARRRTHRAARRGAGRARSVRGASRTVPSPTAAVPRSFRRTARSRDPARGWGSWRAPSTVSGAPSAVRWVGSFASRCRARRGR